MPIRNSFGTLDVRWTQDRQLFAGRQVGATDGYASVASAACAAKDLSADRPGGDRRAAVVCLKEADRFVLREVDVTRWVHVNRSTVRSQGTQPLHFEDFNVRGIKSLTRNVVFVLDDGKAFR